MLESMDTYTPLASKIKAATVSLEWDKVLQIGIAFEITHGKTLGKVVTKISVLEH